MELTIEDKIFLLNLARNTIKDLLDHKSPKFPQGHPLNSIKAGAFVTLHKRGRLRGCIGTFLEMPLLEVIVRMAESSAFHDPRFDPLRSDEFEEIDIEISILTPKKKIADPEQVEVGRHGLYIEKGFRSGVLLPQVPVEEGWDRETFLSYTCLKAGLHKDAWKETDTKIYVFEAIVFGEKELGLIK